MLFLLPLFLMLAPPSDDSDRLYADRANLASAERAAAIWEERLAKNSNDLESTSKPCADVLLAGRACAAGEQA